MSLTAPERETVITFSDDSDIATIHTHQRRMITKFKNNPAADQIEDLTFEGTPGAVFELPVDRISFLGPKKKREMTAARIEAVRRMQQARKAA